MTPPAAPGAKPVTPGRCALGFGIPTDEPGFYLSRERSPNAFARRCAGGWVRYEVDVVAPYNKVVPTLEELGVRVVRDLTLNTLPDLFRTHEVVVLFSHSHEDSVELADKFASTDEMLSAVPEDFGGIFDLSVCHGPKKLIDALDGHRPRCNIRHNAGEATPYVWLYFYRFLFHLLAQQPRGYNDLFSDLIKDLRKHISQSQVR